MSSNNSISEKLTKMIANGDVFITVKLTNNKEIQKLNKQYLNRDYPTDVLSFSYDEDAVDGNYTLGDIVVSVDRAKEQAVEYSNDLAHEVAELVEHGVLHLLGVHHADDDEKTVHGQSVKKETK